MTELTPLAAEFKERLRGLTAKVDAALEEVLPPDRHAPRSLHEAIRYSVFAGGKRLRPALCLLVAEAEAGRLEVDPNRVEQAALRPACALEMVHTYSLIHDDLPCMDDDDLRRGKPTCHRVYGEALAVLAGDALNTMAFECLAATEAPEALAMVTVLAQASGTLGMVGGQVDDLAAQEAETGDAELLESIHERKTAMLFAAAAELGALAATTLATPTAVDGEGGATRRSWKRFGHLLGLAFQIVDDILDVTATTAQMGKRTGKDADAGKLTYPGLHGLESSRERAASLFREARAELIELEIPSTSSLNGFLALLEERST